MKSYSYPAMTRTMTRGKDKFVLHVESGEFTDSEIIVLLGENGTGKVTKDLARVALRFGSCI
jgi:ATP-binding cassette subfamily E protein 1